MQNAVTLSREIICSYFKMRKIFTNLKNTFKFSVNNLDKLTNTII